MRLDHLLSKEKLIRVYYLFFNVLYSTLNTIVNGAVAQLARAPALQAGGQEFDSPQLHHIYYNDNIIIGGTMKNI